MTLRRWDPFGELMNLRRSMDRLLEEGFPRLGARRDGFTEKGNLALDMYQTKDSVVIRTALPGIKPEEVSITISGDTLTIKGEVKVEQEVKEEDYLVKERHYGAYHRTVRLPSNLNVDGADASFENGIVTLTIPKKEETQEREVKVKIRGS